MVVLIDTNIILDHLILRSEDFLKKIEAHNTE
jgi:hypothetical protein